MERERKREKERKRDRERDAGGGNRLLYYGVHGTLAYNTKF